MGGGNWLVFPEAERPVKQASEIPRPVPQFSCSSEKDIGFFILNSMVDSIPISRRLKLPAFYIDLSLSTQTLHIICMRASWQRTRRSTASSGNPAKHSTGASETCSTIQVFALLTQSCNFCSVPRLAPYNTHLILAGLG